MRRRAQRRARRGALAARLPHAHRLLEQVLAAHRRDGARPRGRHAGRAALMSLAPVLRRVARERMSAPHRTAQQHRSLLFLLLIITRYTDARTLLVYSILRFMRMSTRFRLLGSSYSIYI